MSIYIFKITVLLTYFFVTNKKAGPENAVRIIRDPLFIRLSELISLAAALSLRNEAEEREYAEDYIARNSGKLYCYETLHKSTDAKRYAPAAECCGAEHLNPLTKKKNENEHYRYGNEADYHIALGEGNYSLGKKLTAHTNHIGRIACKEYVAYEIKKLREQSGYYTNDNSDYPGSNIHSNAAEHGLKKSCTRHEAEGEEQNEFLEADKLSAEEHLNERKNEKSYGYEDTRHIEISLNHAPE